MTNNFRLLAFVALALAACSTGPTVSVRQMAECDYPIRARSLNIQGPVTVDLLLDTEGNVVSAGARDGPQLLTRFAESNARQWKFRLTGRSKQTAIKHILLYDFRLEGKPVFTAPPATVRLVNPNRVQIIATPVESDYPSFSKQPGAS